MSDLLTGNPNSPDASDTGAKPANMFDSIDPAIQEAHAETTEQTNMFAQFPDVQPVQTSGLGAFTSHAIRGLLPTAGGMAAAGGGAAIGAEIGAFGGPAAPVTVPLGGFIGGLVGFFAGAAATEGTQDWALHQAPDNWQEALGQSTRQQRLQEEQHPYYSFMGGIAPYALTMTPGAFTTRAASLPENATAFQKIMANPVTARAFGGAAMGGMELGQEAWDGQTPDWAKIGVSTGFGLVFNKPTAFGEYLTGAGARTAGMFHQAVPGGGLLNPAEPTVAQAADLGVVGPGITESTFQGTQEQSASTRATAHNAAADEQAALGALPAPDLDGIARRLDTEVFQRTDQLVAQRDSLRRWIQDQSNPTEDMFDELATKRYAAEEALRNANPNGPAARGFRAELTDVAAREQALAARRDAWESGTHVDTPDIMLARQHLLDTEHELWDLAPQLAAARRRAADHVGDFEPEPDETPVSPAEALTAPVPETPRLSEEPLAGIPPVAPGYARFFHGGSPENSTLPTSGGGRWTSPDFRYARDYRRNETGPGAVWYVDLPADHPVVKAVQGIPDEDIASGVTSPQFHGNVEVPEDLAKGFKPYNEAAVAAEAASQTAPKSPEAQRAFITQDRTAQLMRVGLSRQIAQANAHVEAAYYETLAARFGGALGTAEDLYRQRAARVVGPNGQVPPESTPPVTRAAPTPTKIRTIAEIQAEENVSATKAKRIQDEEILARGKPIETVRFTPAPVPEPALTGAEATPTMAQPGIEPASESPPPAARPRLRTADQITREDGVRDPKAVKAVQDQELATLADWQAQQPAAARPKRNRALDRLAADTGLPPVEAAPEAVMEAIVDRLPTERVREEVSAEAEAGDIEYREAEKAAAEILHEVVENPDKFYDSDQSRPLEALESEHRPPNEVIAAQQRPGGGGEPEPATTGAGPVPEGGGPPEPVAGAGGRVEPEGSAAVAGEPAVTLAAAIEPAGARESATGGEQRPATGAESAHINPTNELSQRTKTVIQGRIRIAPGDVRSIITLARTADASTFMHETSHDWLKQLMRDAGHELAPAQLRRDAAIVRQWLKRPDGWTGFKRDAKGQLVPDVVPQEKFARAFEQYLREGHAPSRPLDTVFAQFKSWLTTIYRTLRGLGAPISEDIRGVFDRMLAIEPRRKTFGEAPERPPSIDDIHSMDAERTHPREAEAVRDRVVSERDRHVAGQPPEIAHGLAASTDTTPDAGAGPGGEVEPRGEVGAGSTTSRTLDTGGGKPKPIAPGGGGGIERGAVEPGGGQAEPEGAGVAGRSDGQSNTPNGRRSAGATSGVEQLAPRPAESFTDTEPKLVDRAGNIRVENLTDIDSIAQAIHDSADRNDEFRAVRGGMTKGQMLDLAESMGLDPAKIDETVLARMFGGTQDLGPKILAARRLVVQSAEIVSGLMKTAADGADHDVAALGVAIARHDMIQSVLAGVTAEWGRAGSAFHSLLTGWEKAQDLNQLLKDNLGRDLLQLKIIAKLGSRMDTPGKISKLLRDAKKRSFGAMILEYWINGLISGLATHATYVVGNTILAMEKAGPETAAAAAIGAIRARFGREGTRVRLGEVGAQLRGAIQEAPAAAQAGIEALRSGATTMLPGEAARPAIPFAGDTSLSMSRGMTNAPVTWKEVAGDAYGLMQGMRDGLVAIGEVVKAGEPGAPAVGPVWSPLGQIPDIQIRGGVVPLGTLARLPSRGVAAIHSTFRAMNYSMEINALAYRRAVEDGLSGPAFAARVADLRQNPSEEMMASAVGKATDLTLMGQGGKLTNSLSALFNKTYDLPVLGETALLKFIDPFVHIAGNIMNQSLVQRTPIGLLFGEIRADLMGRNGNIAQDTAMAKMLVGTSLAMTFGGLAAQGLMSGSGPADPRKGAMWRLAGNQAHSVRIGDFWYDIHRLGPMGMLASVSADLYDVAHQIGKEDADVVGKSIMHAFTQNILDESFMRGPADLIKAVTDPDRYGSGYVRNFLTSFLPYSVGMSQVARGMDPYSRQARTIMDAIRVKVPGMSENLFPRRDVWGEPMPNSDALIAAGITSIYERQMSRDPVNQAMLTLGIGPAPVERTIRNVHLTDEQYDEFARIAGRSTKMRLNAIVKSPDYQSWPNATRHEVVEETFKQSREAARGMMMMMYPEIPRQSARMQIDRRTGAGSHPIE